MRCHDKHGINTCVTVDILSVPSASSACGFSAQSSRRKDTKPDSGAGAKAWAICSMDFLSRTFCDRSRNCSFFDYAIMHGYSSDHHTDVTVHTLHRYAPMRRKALGFSRLFDATDRKVNVPGIVRECKIGFKICEYDHEYVEQ